MDFKTYVQSVVASYVEKQNRNLIFIKHYNTLDITRDEILAKVDKTDDKIFLYHEYAMHDMHSSYAPFLQWIRQCYNTYYSDVMTVEDFLRKCNVYSMHIETLSGFIRDDFCSRKEDVLYFEIQFEAYRMMQNILSILEYISKEHSLILIISKLHLAPYSTIKLLRAIVDQSINIHAILMYNDEFIITDYKKQVWNDLLQSVSNQDLQLEWGRLDTERTIDVQDEFWFDKEYKNEYLLKIRNMYYTFSLEDAYYYMNNILGRIDEKTVKFEKSEQIDFIQLAVLIDMNFGKVDQSLVMCDKLTDMQCHVSDNRYMRYIYYYTCARVRMIAAHNDVVIKYCEKCIEIANEMDDSFLACKAKILMWSTYCGIGKDIFEYDFNYKCDADVVEQAKNYGFFNFLAYIYVFGFENEKETIRDIALGIKKPYYFDLGIKLGTEIGNDNFLLNAYMKNIILYSRSGYHRFVRDMYEKRLAVLRKPNPLRESHMLAGLGYNSIILEDFEKAHLYLIQSVINLTELEKPDDVMNSLYNVAMVHFVSENYQGAVSVVEIILKMMKEMNYHSISSCSTIKLYSIIGLSCYYQQEYYNSYYFLSKMDIIVEHMIMVLKEVNEGVWDEDLLLYHLLQGMLYNYEGNYELSLAQFAKTAERAKTSHSSLFFAMPVYYTELSELYLKQGMYNEAENAINEGIHFCEQEQLERKKQRLIYFKEHHTHNTEPIMKKEDNLPLDKIRQITRHAASEMKLDKREKDIKFLTVLQEAISRENMSTEDLYLNTAAVIKNSYSIDDIIILRRVNNKRESMIDDEIDLSDEAFDTIFDFFRTYRQAFLSNRTDKNFNQFLPIMKFFNNKPIMTMIGIPMMEESGTETVLLAYVRVKRRTINSRVLLNGDDLMILKFAFSQFCEMMRRIDNRLMIERMNQKLEQSAITDHLTGITNRSGFSRQAEIICAQGNIRNNVLLYIDLDNFKYYNDTFGHEIGDLVLVTFAKLVKRMSQGSGLAVRYGGDEFIVLLYNKTAQDGVDFAARIYKEISDGFVEKIRAKLKKDICIPEEKKISCSIGIAPFMGGSKEEFELALNRADQMLYYVKRHGKSQYKLFDKNIVNE